MLYAVDCKPLPVSKVGELVRGTANKAEMIAAFTVPIQNLVSPLLATCEWQGMAWTVRLDEFSIHGLTNIGHLLSFLHDSMQYTKQAIIERLAFVHQDDMTPPCNMMSSGGSPRWGLKLADDLDQNG